MHKRNVAYEQLFSLKFEYTGISNANIVYKIVKLQELIEKEEQETFDIIETQNKSKQNSRRSNKLKIPKVVQEKLISEFFERMEHSTSELTYLWQTMAGESPEIVKIDSGIKDSQKGIIECLDFYQKNAKFIQDNCSVLDVYGQYLRDVLGRKEEGGEIVKKALNSFKQLNKQRLKIQNIQVETDISQFSLPCFRIRYSTEVSH